MKKAITLSDIVVSNVWDEPTKKIFFEKLKRVRDSYNKSKNCVDKALNIISKDDEFKLSEALALIDYSIGNFNDDEFSLAYAYSAKGKILERYAHRYLDAFEYYKKWAELNTNLVGHEFARVRSLLRAHKLIASDDIVKIFLTLKDKISNLPSRDHRFWLSVLTSSLYQHDGIMDDSIKFANVALSIYNERGVTFLHKMIKKLEEIPDEIEVTDDEIKILRDRIGKDK